MTRTQVGIIGAGPAGLLLSHLLHLQGIDSVVLERRGREHVTQRVRAGVLEHPTAQLLREVGVGARLDAEGLEHEGIQLLFDGDIHRLDFPGLCGRTVTVYGQQKVVEDLIEARLADAGDVRFEVDVTGVRDLTGRPRITVAGPAGPGEVHCDVVVGADGFHGISRGLMPADTATFQRVYPFAWLGILAQAPPSSKELIYARHADGFALHSMRSPEVTRNYLQVDPDADLADWPDERIWAELSRRLAHGGFTLDQGDIIERGITPMRSFCSEPLQYGRLYLAGDAAHIVPPTGAKGLNLAVADVRVLSRALGAHFLAGDDSLLADYTDTAMRRVWQVTHFSWWMTSMLHRFPDADPFDDRLARAQLDRVVTSPAVAASLAEMYTGLPFDAGWSYR